MRKLIFCMLALSLMLALAGCMGSSNPTTAATDPTQAPTPAPSEPSVPTVPQDTVPAPTDPGDSQQKPMASFSAPAVIETVTAGDGTVIFQYAYQNISLIIQDPDVAINVLQDLQKRIDASKAPAEALKQQAQTDYKGGADWYAYQYQILFEPKRMDHGVLSLFGTTASFSNAARAEKTYHGATYDLITGEEVKLLDIFANDDWAAPVSQLVIQALDEIKLDYALYDDFANTVKARFTGDLSDDTHWYFTQNGLCFFFAPYDIAPYASGVISAEIPYDQLVGILDGAYFPPERENADGSMVTELFGAADLTQFSQICELTLDPNGISLLLHADTSVQDVRISVFSLAGQPSYTAFACYSLTPGDAIMLQVSDSPDQILSLTYIRDGSIVMETITLPTVSG